MRETVFRGKARHGFVYGSLINAENFCCILQAEERVHPLDYPYLDGDLGTIDGQATPVIPETVGQYTGKTDKNGERIFEGDIVTGLFLFGLSVKAVVTFQDGAFGLEWYRGDVKTFNAFTSICNVEYEVIGNVHDNPDLLK